MAENRILRPCFHRIFLDSDSSKRHDASRNTVIPVPARHQFGRREHFHQAKPLAPTGISKIARTTVTVMQPNGKVRFESRDKAAELVAHGHASYTTEAVKSGKYDRVKEHTGGATRGFSAKYGEYVALHRREEMMETFVALQRMQRESGTNCYGRSA